MNERYVIIPYFGGGIDIPNQDKAPCLTAGYHKGPVTTYGDRAAIMEIEKHIIKPYTMNGGGFRYIGQEKVPTICAMYHNVFSTFPEKPYVMEINKKVIKAFRHIDDKSLDYKTLEGDKYPTVKACYTSGIGYFVDRSYIMKTDEELEDNGYVKVDRKLNKKRDQEKASTLTIGGHGAGNHSDMDLFCVAMRGRNPENPSDRTAGIHLEQRLEANIEGKTNCLTTVQKDNLVMSCLTPKRTEYGKRIRKQYESGEIKEQRKNMQQLEPRKDGKTGCLTTVQKDNMVVENLHINDNGELVVPEATKKGFIEVKDGDCFDGSYLNSKTRRGRTMTEKSSCLMNQSQELYRYEGVRKIQQLNDAKEFGNQPRQQHRVYSEEGISPTLNTARPDKVLTRCRIRRLTPTECARLQSIPDWYEWKGKFPDGKIKDTSDTQRYRLCGNGWNVEVIKHIFSFIDIVK